MNKISDNLQVIVKVSRDQFNPLESGEIYVSCLKTLEAEGLFHPKPKNEIMAGTKCLSLKDFDTTERMFYFLGESRGNIPLSYEWLVHDINNTPQEDKNVYHGSTQIVVVYRTIWDEFAEYANKDRTLVSSYMKDVTRYSNYIKTNIEMFQEYQEGNVYEVTVNKINVCKCCGQSIVEELIYIDNLYDLRGTTLDKEVMTSLNECLDHEEAKEQITKWHEHNSFSLGD
jgi:hypothetical protein